MAECPTPEKQQHRHRHAALKARDAFEKAKGLEIGLDPYRCRCGSWHLGHKRKSRQMPTWARRAGLNRLNEQPTEEQR